MPMVRLRVPRGTRIASRVQRAQVTQNAARRANRGQAIRKLARGIHYFKRTAYYSGFISGSTLLDTYGSLIFQLQNVPNAGEFTSLFDQYMIKGVKVVFMPRANSAEIGTNQGLVKFFTAIDRDDNTAPTSIAQLLQYENMKCTASNRDHSRYFAPRVAKTVYNTALTSGFGQAGPTWLDCDNAAVPHYGIKYALQQLPAGNQSYDIKVTYYLAFKNVN